MKRLVVLSLVLIMCSALCLSVFAREPILNSDRVSHYRSVWGTRVNVQSFVLPEGHDKISSIELFINFVGSAEQGRDRFGVDIEPDSSFDDTYWKDDALVVSIYVPKMKKSLFGDYSPDGPALATSEVPITTLLDAMENTELVSIPFGDNEVRIGFWFNIPIEAKLTPGEEYVFQLEMKHGTGFVNYGLALADNMAYPDFSFFEKSFQFEGVFRFQHLWQAAFRIY